MTPGVNKTIAFPLPRSDPDAMQGVTEHQLVTQQLLDQLTDRDLDAIIERAEKMRAAILEKKEQAKQHEQALEIGRQQNLIAQQTELDLAAQEALSAWPPINEGRPNKRQRERDVIDDDDDGDGAATAQTQGARKKRKRHCPNCGADHTAKHCPSQIMREHVLARMEVVRSMEEEQHAE